VCPLGPGDFSVGDARFLRICRNGPRDLWPVEMGRDTLGRYMRVGRNALFDGICT